jgi:hypothetical protein
MVSVTKWSHYSGGKELALEFRAETGFCAPAHALSTCRHATWLAYRNSKVIVDDDKQADKVDYTPFKRYSYSREYKLIAIDYFQTI